MLCNIPMYAVHKKVDAGLHQLKMMWLLQYFCCYFNMVAWAMHHFQMLDE